MECVEFANDLSPVFYAAFFFISWFCSTFDKPCAAFLWAQVRQLLLPIVSFSVFLIVLNGLYPAGGQKWYTWDYVLYGGWLEGSYFWFLDALLFSKLLVYFLNRCVKRSSYRLVFLLLALVAGFLLRNGQVGQNYFHLWQGLGSAFFVGVGAWAREHREWYEKILVRCFLFFPWLLLVLVLCHVPIPVFTLPMNVTMGQIPLFIFLSLTGSFAFLYGAKKLHRCLSFFNYWGKNTLIIYCFNSYFLLCVVDGVSHVVLPESNGAAFLFMSASFAGMALLSTVAVYLFNTRYLSWAVGRFRVFGAGPREKASC